MKPDNQWEAAEQRRQQALTEILAGDTSTTYIPSSPTTVTPATDNIYKQRENSLSKLGLLDEDMQPSKTKTYTNYYNQTNQPSMDGNHELLLFLDKRDQYKALRETNQISEREYLSLYTTDILKENGYDIDNAAWWKQRFQNGNWTNPFEDKTLQQNLLNAARERDALYEAQYYAQQKKVNDSNISAYLAKGDLSNEEIAQLFPELTKAIEETSKSEDYRHYILSNQVSFADRLYTTSTGERYVLHTDGKLYKVTNEESGPHVMNYTEDANGNLTSLSINGDDVGDFIHTAVAGFSKSVLSVGSLVAAIWGGTVGAITSNTSWTDSIAKSMNDWEAFQNEHLSLLVDSDYIDLDGFNSFKDGAIMVANVGGMVAGAVLMGGISKGIAGKGAKLAETSTNPFLKATGNIMKHAGSAYARSTGHYAGYFDDVAQDTAVVFGHKIYGGWGYAINTAKTASTYAIKDFTNTIQQLHNERANIQYNRHINGLDPLEFDDNIAAMAASNAVLNFAISWVFTGGIDDNQAQRWSTMLAKKVKDADGIQHLQLSGLGRWLMKHRVSVNTVGDFIDNYATMITGNMIGFDSETGELNAFEHANVQTAFSTLIQAAVTTTPTLLGNLKGRNMMEENIVTIGKNALDEIDNRIKASKNPEETQALEALKTKALALLQVKTVKDKQGNEIQPTLGQRYAYMLDQLHTGIKDANEQSFVTGIIDSVCNAATIRLYDEMSQLANERLALYATKHSENLEALSKGGVRAFFKKKFIETFTPTVEAARLGENIRTSATKAAETLIDRYLTITDSKEATTAEDKLRAAVDIAAEKTASIEEHYLSFKLISDAKPELANVIKEKAAAMAKASGNPDLTEEDVLASTRFVVLKNETSDRQSLNSERAAMTIAETLLPEMFYKIDDDVYGVIAVNSEISKTFAMDTQIKLSFGMQLLGENNQLAPQAVDMMVKTIVGDTKAKSMTDSELRGVVEELLQVAIKNKVIDEIDAAEFVLSLAKVGEQEDAPSLAKQMNTAFRANLNVKNAKDMKDLTDIEKFALVYESFRVTNSKNKKRFSSEIIAADIVKAQAYDELTTRVLNAMKNRGLLSDSVKEAFIQHEAAKTVFQLATDRLKEDFMDVIKIIGEGGHRDILKGDEAASKSYLTDVLKGLAKAKDSDDEALKQRAQDLLDFFKLIGEFKEIEYIGDKVIVDLAQFSTEGTRAATNEVVNVSAASVEGMSKRGTLNNKAPESDVVKVLDTAVELETTKTKTIMLDDANMEDIIWLYNKLIDAKFIDPSFYKNPPKTAADMIKILSEGLTEDGKKFAIFKKGIEFNTGIFDDAAAAILKERLANLDTNQLSYAIKVLDPNNAILQDIDHMATIYSNVRVNKISEFMQARAFRNGNKPVYINPVDPAQLNTDANGVPVFIKYDINNPEKVGRAASKYGSKPGLFTSEAVVADVNKDLALTMMVSRYIDVALEYRNSQVWIPRELMPEAERLGIVGDNGFYAATVDDGGDYIGISLKASVSRADMEYYLLTSDKPNLFKILPFVSNKKAVREDQFRFPGASKLEFVPDVSGGNQKDPRNIEAAMNEVFDFDQTGRMREYLIIGLFDRAQKGVFEFNPFSSMRVPLDLTKLKANKKYKDMTDLEIFKEYRKGEVQPYLNDPYYLLAASYKDLSLEYVYGKVSNKEENQDHLLWLGDPNVVKALVNAAKAGKKVDEKFLSKIKNIYLSTHSSEETRIPYDNISYNYSDFQDSQFYLRAMNTGGDSYMSKGILDKMMGTEYQLITKDDLEKPDVMAIIDQQITDAYEYVKNNIAALEDTRSIIQEAFKTESNYRFLFQPSEATEIWTILSASEGKINIEDLDKLRRMSDAAYNELFEKMGYDKGYGAKVKEKINAKYKELRKHMVGSTQRIKLRVSNRRFGQAATQGATLFDSPGHRVGSFNPEDSKQVYKLANKPKGDFYVDREENITSEKLIDAIANDTRDFANDYFFKGEFSSKYIENEKNKVTQQLKREFAKTQVEDNLDIYGNSEMIDISADINLAKLSATTSNTMDSIKAEIVFENTDKDFEDNFTEYVAQVVKRTTGSQMVSSPMRFSFLDMATGKEFASANITKSRGYTSHIDLLLTMFDDSKSNSDWIGKVFFDFDKHNYDNPQGLTYSYKILKTEMDVINFKNQVLLKVLAENEFRLKDVEGTNLFDKLHNMNNAEYNNLIQHIISDTITLKHKMNIAKNSLAKTNIQDMWKVLLMPQDFSDGVNKSTIRGIMGTRVSALDSESDQVRRIARAIIYGIDYDSLDPRHRSIVDNVRKKLMNNFLPDKTLPEIENLIATNIKEISDMEYRLSMGRKLSDTELTRYKELYEVSKDLFDLVGDTPANKRVKENSNLVTAMKRYIMNHYETSEVLDYLYNSKRTLQERYINLRDKVNDDVYSIKTGNESEVKNIPASELIKFFNKDKTTTIRKIIAYDTEGSNINKVSIDGSITSTALSIRDLFQIAIITYENIDGKFVERENIYYITHDIDNAEWVKQNIDRSDSFYKDNEHYREAIEKYVKGGEGVEYKTEEEIKAILACQSETAPDLYIAYNGDNFEFRLFDDAMVRTAGRMDATVSVFKHEGDTTKRVGLDAVRKRRFGLDNDNEYHEAMQDTRDMMDLMKNYFQSDNDIANEKNRLIESLVRLFPENLTEEQKLQALGYVDDFFDKYTKDIRKEFNDYNPTIDSIRELQRSFNYLKNDARGKAYFQIMEALGSTRGYGTIINDKVKAKNLLDVVSLKSLATGGDVYKAISELKFAYYSDDYKTDKDKGLFDFVEKIATKDAELLRVAGIDLSKTESGDFKDAYRNVKNIFKGGMKAFLDGEMPGIPKELAHKYEDNRYLIPYTVLGQTIIKDAKNVLDDDTLDILMDSLVNDPISLIEGMDRLGLIDYEKNTVQYKDAGVKQLMEQIQNITGDNLGTGLFAGLYSMMGSVPTKNTGLIELDPLTNTVKGELTNVEAGDMVISMGALKKFFKVYDTDMLRASDGNLYLLSITYPADNPNAVLPLRVRVIEGDDLTIRFTPQTQEILRNRDFDGDHTMTTVLSPERTVDIDGKVKNSGMLDLAPVLHKLAWNAENMIENLAYDLFNTPASYTTKEFEMLKLGSLNSVVRDCYEIDKILAEVQKYNVIPDNYIEKINKIHEKMAKHIKESQEFEETRILMALMPEDEDKFIEDVISNLTYKEYFSGASDPIRFVRNPVMYSQKIFGGKVETHTYKARKAFFARQRLTTSNVLDPTVGTYQKILSALPMGRINVVDPLKDLYTPGLYIPSGMEAEIRAQVTSESALIDYVGTLKEHMLSQLSLDKYNSKSLNIFTNEVLPKMESLIISEAAELSKAGPLTKEQFGDLAMRVTQIGLDALDSFTHNYDNLSADMQHEITEGVARLTEDSTLRIQLNKTRDLDRLYQELKGTGLQVSGKSIGYTPWSDLFESEIIASRVNLANDNDVDLIDSATGKKYKGSFNFMNRMDKKLLSENVVRESVGYSKYDNTMTIFVTKGIAPGDEDTIGINTLIDKNGKKYTTIKDYKAEVVDIKGVTLNDNIQKGAVIREGQEIGKYDTQVPLCAEYDMIITKVDKGVGGLGVRRVTEVSGKKLAGVGFFKGGTKSMHLIDIDEPIKDYSASDVNLVVDIHNLSKNWDKYAQGFDFRRVLKTKKAVRFKDDSGVVREGYILKGIPTSILESDLDFEAKLDIDDPSNLRHREIMTSKEVLGLEGIGLGGDMIIKRDAKTGELYLDFSEIQSELAKNAKNHDVIWSDAGTITMYLRTAALLNAISDDEAVGLFKNSAFNSKQEYLENLRKSPERINSEFSRNDQYALIRLLGLERFKKLVNSSKLTKYIFGAQIENLLNPMVPSTFSKEFYEKPRSAVSKGTAKSQYEAMDPDMRYVFGAYINDADKDVHTKLVAQNILLHLPYNHFLRGISDNSYINENALVRGVREGRLGHRVHLKDSATLGNGWNAVDSGMGVKLNISDMERNQAALGLKSIIEGGPDATRMSRWDEGEFKEGSGIRDVFDNVNDATRPTYYNNLASSMDDERISSGFSTELRFMHLMALMNDPTKSPMEKLALLNHYEAVEYNKLTSQFISKDGKLSYERVHDHDIVPIKDAMRKINDNTTGYMLRKDIEKNMNIHKFGIEDVKNFKDSGVLDDYSKKQKELKELERNYNMAQEKLKAQIENMGTPIANKDIQFSWDAKHSTKPFRSSLWTRSGIAIDNADHLGVDIGIKNFKAESEFIQLDYRTKLNELQTLIHKSGVTTFEDFAKYRYLQAAEGIDEEGFQTRLEYLDVSKEDYEKGYLKNNYEVFLKNNPEVVKAYDNFVDGMIELAERASAITNEPFDAFYIFMAPYVPRNPDTRDSVVLNNLKTMASVQSAYDPISRRNAIEQNMMFNFFEGSRKMIDDLSKIISADNISQALLGRYTGNKLIDNVTIVDKAWEIISDPDVIADLKVYNKFDSDISHEVLNVVAGYTDLDISRLKAISKNGSELLLNAYQETHGFMRHYMDQYKSMLNIGYPEPTLSEVYRAGFAPAAKVNENTRQLAQKLYNAMWAEVIIGQRIVECSSKASDKLVKYIAQLQRDGFSLVNKFGQKIQKGGTIAPLYNGSLSYLKENIELSYNSKSDTMFAQYVLEKALSGEIYLAQNDLADQLESKVYTSKVPKGIMKLLKKISTTSAGIQMALPAKMVSRLLRYTGSDYAIGVISNPDVAANIPRAAKELSQALFSKGKTITPGSNLYEYLIREGQPSLYGGTNRDPINFTEDMGEGIIGKITDGMTKPLDFQNHLGRYAIYLTAKESFDEGRPWYGSQYYMKDAIDGLGEGTNADKAMYVMDYMLGSPGGFPYLSKHTSGLMMFATFPMNLTRTLGSYAMSVGRLFQEGITENNAIQWYKTVIMPSLMACGMSLLAEAIIREVCDYYEIPEEKEEEWVEAGVTLDPIGTLIGGTPNVVYDSINPVYQVKEMFINPFTNEYNETLPEKAYGWIKANMLSKLNPAIKVPIEVLSGRDLYGDSAEGMQVADPWFSGQKKHQYTNIENGMRKMYGFLVGTNIANRTIDQSKYDSYDDKDTGFLSALIKGFAKGLMDDLGNQKSWKKDTSYYYSFISDMRRFYNEAVGNTDKANYLDIEDMSSTEELYYNRNYSTQYGEFNKDDYNRVNAWLKKMINNHESATLVYSYIVKEYNENNVSEATLRAALNNNSIVRKLNALGEHKQAYLNSLTNAEKIKLQEAIKYEQDTYPMLQELFPISKSTSSTKLPYSKYYYTNSYGSYYPKRYYPGKYYPQTSYYDRMTKSYKNTPELNVPEVNVNPEMGIWSNDYNLTSYDTGVDYKDRSDLEWLR